MDRAEFDQLFGSYRTAKEWDVTISPEAVDWDAKKPPSSINVFRDVMIEMTLQQIRDDGKILIAKADHNLHMWSRRLTVGMSVDKFASLLAEKDKDAPHIIKGKLMRMPAVALFSMLGVVRCDGQLETWLPRTLTKQSGSAFLVRKVFGIPAGEVVSYMVKTARRLGIRAYNYENALCKLSVAFFKHLGLYVYCATD